MNLNQITLPLLHPTFVVLFLLIICLLTPSMVLAGCRCVCIDGVNQAACSNVADHPPICPRRACPSPRVDPMPRRVTPTGKSVCVPQKFYNVYTGRYERREVCY